MQLEEYKKEQANNRAGIVQEDVQPPGKLKNQDKNRMWTAALLGGGLKVWSDHKEIRRGTPPLMMEVDREVMLSVLQQAQ